MKIEIDLDEDFVGWLKYEAKRRGVDFDEYLQRIMKSYAMDAGNLVDREASEDMIRDIIPYGTDSSGWSSVGSTNTITVTTSPITWSSGSYLV